jgi:hypothetical protein
MRRQPQCNSELKVCACFYNRNFVVLLTMIYSPAENNKDDENGIDYDRRRQVLEKHTGMGTQLISKMHIYCL